MKYVNSILLLVIAVILFGALNFKKNIAFEYYDTFKLFKESTADSISWEVVADSASGDFPYKRVKFTNPAADTFLSQPIENRSGWAYLTIRGEAIDSIYVDVYVGQFVGMATGDALGMKWYKLLSATSNFANEYNLQDSTWYGAEAHPYSMIKIIETKPVRTQFVIDWIAYKSYR